MGSYVFLFLLLTTPLPLSGTTFCSAPLPKWLPAYFSLVFNWQPVGRQQPIRQWGHLGEREFPHQPKSPATAARKTWEPKWCKLGLYEISSVGTSVAVVFVMNPASGSDSVAIIVPGERLIGMALIVAPYLWPACSLPLVQQEHLWLSVAFPYLCYTTTILSVLYCNNPHQTSHPLRYVCAGTQFT